MCLCAEYAVQEFSQVLALHTDLSIAVVTCEVNWRTLLCQHHVIVTTAVVFLAAVAQGFLSSHHINLAVFDQCHDIINSGHPYAEVMNVLNAGDAQNHEDQDRPQTHILGLTTSVLSDIVQPCELEQRLT